MINDIIGMIQEYIDAWLPMFGWMYWVSVVVCIILGVGVLVWAAKKNKAFTLFDFCMSVMWLFFSITPPFNVVFTIAVGIMCGAELLMMVLDRK